MLTNTDVQAAALKGAQHGAKVNAAITTAAKQTGNALKLAGAYLGVFFKSAAVGPTKAAS